MTLSPAEIYNVFINNSRRQKKLDCNELYKRLENKVDKDRLNKFITVLDSMDNNQDGTINFQFTGKGTESIFELVMSKCFGIPKEEGAADAKFSDEDIIRIFGGDFKNEIELTAEAILEMDTEDINRETAEIQTEYADIPLDLLNKMGVGKDTKLTKIESGYKNEYDNDSDTTNALFFDEKGDLTKTEIHHKNGLTETITSDDKAFAEFGRTKVNYLSMDHPLITNGVVNNGLPNETNFEIVYNDDGEAIDVKVTSDTLIKIDDNNKNLLLESINNEEYLGLEYDIQVDGYSIIVSKLENQ
jgi:hypothetical protein